MGTAPFTGSFRPTGTLSSLDGHRSTSRIRFGQWVPGIWTLQLTNTKTGATGTLDNWSLSITPLITVTPVVASEIERDGRDQVHDRLPAQQLSGTYTIQLGPISRTRSATGSTPTRTRASTCSAARARTARRPRSSTPRPILPKPIPAPTQTARARSAPRITVPDNFLIQGDTTAAGVSGMQVQLNLTYPNDPDLTATLYTTIPAATCWAR